MADPLAWIANELKLRADRGLQRTLKATEALDPGRLGRDGRTFIDFGSNDYLGLARDPRLAEAALAEAARSGWGSGASPLVVGWRPAHEVLAAALAEFEQVEAVALFGSGYAANLGTVAALVGRGDAVYVDRLAHACLIDGARVSGATLRVFPHNDVDRLERAIARDAGRFRRSLIAVDAVYSMDGDLAPLADLAAIADRFDAILLADEAHGTGVYGPDGRGASAELGVAERVHVRVGTLSKALGSAGGFVAGSRALVEWMIQAARPLIYSTAMPAPSAAAATRALAIARAEPWRRERARALGSRLRGGIEGARAGSGPIVPLILGDTNSALAATARLRDRGFLAPAIRPPTVPEGTARLRLSASAAHTEADVDALIEALAEQAAGG